MALLMTWLSEGETVPLEDPSASFEALCERWVRAVATAEVVPAAARAALVRRFFELLEANADESWLVPDDVARRAASRGRRGRRRAARVRVGLRGDDVQGLDRRRRGRLGRRQRRAEGGGPTSRSKPRPTRSRSGCGSCTRSRSCGGSRPGRTCGRATTPPGRTPSPGWLAHRAAHARRARRLPRPRHRDRGARPAGGHEGMIEFDRRRALKGHILELGVAACVEMGRAARRWPRCWLPGRNCRRAGSRPSRASRAEPRRADVGAAAHPPRAGDRARRRRRGADGACPGSSRCSAPNRCSTARRPTAASRARCSGRRRRCTSSKTCSPGCRGSACSARRST